jgi:hypothetical protein
VGSDGSTGDAGCQTSSEKYTESRDIWGDYNDRQKFEHELIDRKTRWLATAQTILFAAYGITWKDPVADGAQAFRNIVACAGIAVAVVTLVGVVTVIISKFLSWRDYKEFYESNTCYLPRPFKVEGENPKVEGEKLEWGVRTWNTWLTLVPDVFLPIIFAGAWVAVRLC